VGSKGESRAARQPGLEAGAAVRADDGKVLCMRVNHIKPYDESQWQPLFFPADSPLNGWIVDFTILLVGSEIL
jgi:hypothetical protein